MDPVVREIEARTALAASKVFDYALNPYVGCQHACTYCYARFMRRFSGHAEPWGAFVDVKANLPALLPRELARKRPGTVWLSGVCDPYQPLEARCLLTRRCLALLVAHDWPVAVQTRSPLVLRDLDLLAAAPGVTVTVTVTTADDRVRRLFEPAAPPVAARLRALAALHRAGVRTAAMVAPLLPGAERLPEALAGSVDEVLVDRLNYHYADRVYARHGLQAAREDGFFRETAALLATAFAAQGVPRRLRLQGIRAGRPAGAGRATVSLALADLEHLGAAVRADTLDGRLAVLHGDGLLVLHDLLRPALHAVRLGRHALSFRQRAGLVARPPDTGGQHTTCLERAQCVVEPAAGWAHGAPSGLAPGWRLTPRPPWRGAAGRRLASRRRAW